MLKNIIKRKVNLSQLPRIDDYIALVTQLFVNKFTNTSCSQFLKTNTSSIGDSHSPKVLIKHDVHSDLDMPIIFAFKENISAIRSIYFITLDWQQIDSSRYLANIRKFCQLLLELGHEIGLHIDFFYWAKYKRLSEAALESVLQYLETANCRISFINTHGNTSFHSSIRNSLIFFEEHEGSQNQRELPIEFNEYVGALSFSTFVNLGISHSLDPRILSFETSTYLDTNYATDNSGGITITTPANRFPNSQIKRVNKHSRLSYKYLPDILADLEVRKTWADYQFLIHPQQNYYRYQ